NFSGVSRWPRPAPKGGSAVHRSMPFRVVFSVFMSALFALVGFSALPFPDTAAAQDAPALQLVSPTDDATINTTDILVQVSVENFTVNCDQSGHDDQDGTGQIVAFI